MIVHGDSFDFGSGSIIDGSKLVRQHQMIVVTFNYRLNILGKFDDKNNNNDNNNKEKQRKGRPIFSQTTPEI